MSKDRPARGHSAGQHGKSSSKTSKPSENSNKNLPLKTKSARPEWAMIGCRSARHYKPDRYGPHEDVLTSLHVFDGDERSVREAFTSSKTLLRLEMPSCGLRELPTDFPTTMRNLTRMNLSENELTEDSFPETMSSMISLVEIDISDNKLTVVPQCICNMRRLKRLYVGYNSISQFPDVKCLEGLIHLNLEENNITEVPWKTLADHCRRLSILNVRHNQLTVIDKNVRLLRELTTLDLSENQIHVIPAEMFYIKRLSHLDLSNNQLVRLPQCNPSHRSDNQLLETIDLSNNKIYKFSEWLLFLAHQVDLSNNEISNIQENCIQNMDYQAPKLLNVLGNPLKSPPVHVCESGYTGIIKYFKESKLHNKIYQGMKVFVIGAKSSGKSSLIQTLADEQPRLTLSDESTDMCEISTIDMTTTIEGEERLFSLSVWDLSGDMFFMNGMHHFLDNNALYILTFNLATYRTGEFDQNFGQWLTYIMARNNQMKLLVVGTHSDLLKETTVRRITDEVSTCIDKYFQSYQAFLKQKISQIEVMENIGTYMQGQLKYYVSTSSNVRHDIYGKPIAVSCASYDGIEKVSKAIKDIIGNKSWFPDGLQPIPSLWNDIHDTVDEIAKSENSPILSLNEFKHKLVDKHGLKNMLDDICAYLHRAGVIIWLRNNNVLKSTVFLRPMWLFRVLRSIVCKRIGEVSYDDLSEQLIANRVLRYQFEGMKKEFLAAGVLHLQLLKAMICREAPNSQFNPEVVMEIIYLLFELCYPYNDHSSSTTANSVNSDYTPRSPTRELSTSKSREALDADEDDGEPVLKRKESTANSFPPLPIPEKVIVPCLRPGNKPEYIDHLFDDFCVDMKAELYGENFWHLSSVLTFPKQLPAGILPRLIVRLHHPSQHLVFKENWNHGLYAENKYGTTAFIIDMYGDKEVTQTGNRKWHIRLEACKKEKIDFKAVQDLWAEYLPLLMNLEDLLSEFTGLAVERFMECPFCASASFNGEWLAPKDLQNAKSLTCQNCHNEVKTELLIQPREKKAAEQLWRVIMDLNKRRQQRALKANRPNELKMKLALSAFGAKKPPSTTTAATAVS